MQLTRRVIDWVVWDHPPTLAVLVGMALVIGGGLIAIFLRPRTSSTEQSEAGPTAVGSASGATAVRSEE